MRKKILHIVFKCFFVSIRKFSAKKHIGCQQSSVYNSIIGSIRFLPLPKKIKCKYSNGDQQYQRDHDNNLVLKMLQVAVTMLIKHP
jgi:hypothetical protein